VFASNRSESRRAQPLLRQLHIVPAYAKAMNILHKMPVKMDFVSEQEAGKFSRELADEMAKHPPV